MIENMKVRRFKEEDAQEVRNLIVRNFLEVNSKDYGISAMEKLAKAWVQIRSGIGMLEHLSLAKSVKLYMQILGILWSMYQTQKYGICITRIENFLGKTISEENSYR